MSWHLLEVGDEPHAEAALAPKKEFQVPVG